MTWAKIVISGLGVALVGWIAVTAWPAIVHGHPIYAILLVVTLAVCVFMLVRAWRPRPAPRGWRLALGIVLAVLGVGWLGLIWWLTPFSAQEPALTAMQSDALVTVEESATGIVMTPTSNPSSTGVFFQPGAKVDARAYAAVLRPLAEAGYSVVIPKQPLGIAFLATGAFESAQGAHPEISDWVVGGHSLGGTVAAMDAEAHDADAASPVTGLMLYASYPASDISSTLTSKVLSLFGTNDGLATPSDIDASRANLPAGAVFTPIEGGVHAFFGDYGPQPGDGSPTITHDEARQLIARHSLDFLSGVGSASGN
jgi:hypothetical protein